MPKVGIARLLLDKLVFAVVTVLIFIRNSESLVVHTFRARSVRYFLLEIPVFFLQCPCVAPANKLRDLPTQTALIFCFFLFLFQLSGIYQTAQNLAVGHLTQKCDMVPESIRKDLIELKDTKSGAGGGRKYWSDGASVNGVYETIDGILRFRPRSRSNSPEVKEPPFKTFKTA